MQPSDDQAKLTFNQAIKVEPAKVAITSDAGALFLREIEEQLGFFDGLQQRLRDPRLESACTYTLAELLRARCLLIALGYNDQDDADALRHDPAIDIAVAGKRGQGAMEKQLASQPTLSRLTDMLSTRHNRRALLYAPMELAISAFPIQRDNRHRYLTLDLDSTDHETHGYQQGANYNGYYEETCYHPLIASIAETGDLCGTWLRKGNVSSARGSAAFAIPIIDRLQGRIGQVVDVRGDAAFATPRLMDPLEERGIKYVFRLSKNNRLAELAQPYLSRPPGRPPNVRREWTYDLAYRAESWDRPRRIVLVVVDDPEDRFMGELELRYFFLVTTHSADAMPGEALLDHYRQRGTFESWIGEFKRDVAPRLSSALLCENQATLSLFAIAYQWLHIARMLTDRVERRDTRSTIATFRFRLLKVAGTFSKTARRVVAKIEEWRLHIWSLAIRFLHSRANIRLAGSDP